MRTRIGVILFGVLSLLGCAADRAPDAAFGDVRRSVNERAGATIHWNNHSAADAEVEARVRELVARDLTADAAVQVALLNAPSLQARYEEIGIAQADLVQAGLLKNPVFDASLRWPNHGGPNVEFAVAADFLDALFIPAKRKIAAAKLEQAKLEVGDAVIAHAAEVRRTYYALQAARQMLELRESVLAAEELAAETSKRMRDAGNLSELDQASEQAMFEQSRLEQMRAASDVRQQREQLAALMGVSGGVELEVGPRLPDAIGDVPDVDTLTSLAARQRLDLDAAKQNVNALADSLGLAKGTRFLSGGSIGIDTERETDGQRVTGPVFSIPIPLFDLGQANVARLRARFRQATQQLAALELQAASEIRQAHARLTSARERAERYRTVVLPLQHRIVEQAQLHYNGMLLGLFQLLQAKQNEINAGRDYVEALRDYWIARTELEHAVGGRLPSVTSTQPSSAPPPPPPTTSAPAVAPMSQPAAGHEHHHH